MLFGLQLLGILIHNLVKINEINKKTNGDFKPGYFFKMEWPTIFISLCIAIVAIIAKAEIKQLDVAGGYLGLGFVFIGYGGQSLLFKYFGRIEKKLKKEEEKTE